MDAAHIVATNLAREIITALDTWTPEHDAAAYGSSYSTTQDVQTLQFLRTCCLVNRQWCSLARPLLYRCLRVGEWNPLR